MSAKNPIPESLNELLRKEAPRLSKEIVGVGAPSDAATVRSGDLCIGAIRSVSDLREKLEILKTDLCRALPVGKRVANTRWVNVVDSYRNPDGYIGHFEGDVVAVENS